MMSVRLLLLLILLVLPNTQNFSAVIIIIIIIPLRLTRQVVESILAGWQTEIRDEITAIRHMGEEITSELRLLSSRQNSAEYSEDRLALLTMMRDSMTAMAEEQRRMGDEQERQTRILEEVRTHLKGNVDSR
jgi:hypothetical protein